MEVHTDLKVSVKLNLQSIRSHLSKRQIEDDVSHANSNRHSCQMAYPVLIFGLLVKLLSSSHPRCY